jgi:hypothetical protein
VNAFGGCGGLLQFGAFPLELSGGTWHLSTTTGTSGAPSMFGNELSSPGKMEPSSPVPLSVLTKLDVLPPPQLLFHTSTPSPMKATADEARRIRMRWSLKQKGDLRSESGIFTDMKHLALFAVSGFVFCLTTQAAKPAEAALAPTRTTVGTVTMDCSTPKKTIESQYAAIVAGAPAALVKTCFTDRQKERITDASIAAAKAEISKMTMADLYATEEADGANIKVKMKNGRTLTTLIKSGSSWNADTIWFK